MSGSAQEKILVQIVRDFEVLSRHLDQCIRSLAANDSGSFDLASLHRASRAAQKGAELARQLLAELPRNSPTE